jgi:hypothetical protein
MNTIAINWLAAGLGSLVIFMINAIWFGPKTFYPVWWKALGQEMPETSAQDTSAKEMVRLFGSSLAAAVAQALVLTIFISVAAGVAEVNLLLGGLVGLAFGVVAMGASLPHRLFGQQGFKVWIIEVGADVVSLVVAGVVIAALV